MNSDQKNAMDFFRSRREYGRGGGSHAPAVAGAVSVIGASVVGASSGGAWAVAGFASGSMEKRQESIVVVCVLSAEFTHPVGSW